jgi:phospholipase D-like protein
MDWWEIALGLVIAVPLVVVWLTCVVDALSRPDLVALQKMAWALFILLVPFFGVLTYILMRPSFFLTQPKLRSQPRLQSRPTYR